MDTKLPKMFFATMAMMFFAAMPLHAAEKASSDQVSQITGEINWVDTQVGKLELNRESPEGAQTTAYRITQNDTRVTDQKDQQFLSVEDLRAGQYVTIDVVRDKEDQIVKKIVLEPMPVSQYSQAFGVLKSIDAVAATFVVEERVRIDQVERSKLTNFTYDPKTIVVMHSPSKQPVELVLKPGDVVRVEYVIVDGNEQARYITLYSPVITSTTTTTTTTISH